MCTIKNQRGFTLIEMLIAVALSGIIISGGFSFYSKMQDQTTVQIEMSNIQNIARSSIEDISTTLRQAGYKLDGHEPYEINGDSLMIFYSMYDEVDTVSYFLASSSNVSGFDDDDDDDDDDNDDDDDDESSEKNTYFLMKGCSYSSTSIYADNIVSINFESIEDNIIKITIKTQSEYQDESYNANNGYRDWTLSETVCIRNI